MSDFDVLALHAAAASFMVQHPDELQLNWWHHYASLMGQKAAQCLPGARSWQKLILPSWRMHGCLLEQWSQPPGFHSLHHQVWKIRWLVRGGKGGGDSRPWQCIRSDLCPVFLLQFSSYMLISGQTQTEGFFRSLKWKREGLRLKELVFSSQVIREKEGGREDKN